MLPQYLAGESFVVYKPFWTEQNIDTFKIVNQLLKKIYKYVFTVNKYLAKKKKSESILLLGQFILKLWIYLISYFIFTYFLWCTQGFLRVKQSIIHIFNSSISESFIQTPGHDYLSSVDSDSVADK